MKFIIAASVVAGLLCGAAFAVNQGINTVAGMVKDARDTAISERDAHWQVEIAKSNLAVAYAQLAASKQVSAVNDAAEDNIALVERQAIEKRKDSDALPANIDDCGLSADGVGVLDH